MIVCRMFQTMLNEKFYTHKIQITLILLERFECNKHTRTRNNSFWFLSYLCVLVWQVMRSIANCLNNWNTIKLNGSRRENKNIPRKSKRSEMKKKHTHTTLNHVMKNLCIRFHIFLYRFYFILKYFIRIYYYMFPLRQKWTLN